MRAFSVGLVAVLFVGATMAPLFAAPETVSGRVVDEACYLKDTVHNKFADHKMPADVAGCAVTCAKKGSHLAILTRSGKLYRIAGAWAANNNAKLIGFVNGRVVVTGDVTTVNGTSIITAETVSSDWEEDS